MDRLRLLLSSWLDCLLAGFAATFAFEGSVAAVYICSTTADWSYELSTSHTDTPAGSNPSKLRAREDTYLVVDPPT